MGVLCRLGVHRPLSGHSHLFVDSVSGKTVFGARCPCGRRWMVDSLYGFLGFKVERKKEES
jgi:hypothetical protein